MFVVGLRCGLPIYWREAHSHIKAIKIIKVSYRCSQPNIALYCSLVYFHSWCTTATSKPFKCCLLQSYDSKAKRTPISKFLCQCSIARQQLVLCFAFFSCFQKNYIKNMNSHFWIFFWFLCGYFGLLMHPSILHKLRQNWMENYCVYPFNFFPSGFFFLRTFRQKKLVNRLEGLFDQGIKMNFNELLYES